MCLSLRRCLLLARLMSGAIAFVLSAHAAAPPAPLAPALAFEDIDLAACAVTVADSADAARAPHTTPAEAAYVRAALGLATDGWGWGWPG